MGRRITEIDKARGIALILMTAYHSELVKNWIYGIRYEAFMWTIIGRISGFLFVLISGASIYIYFKNKRPTFLEMAKKRMNILLSAIAITIGTIMAIREMAVWFGVLHFLFISSIASYPILFRSRNERMVLGMILFSIGTLMYLTGYDGIFPLTPKNFSTLDYYPIIPWIGVFLIGTGIGEIMMKRRSGEKSGGILERIGRKTLTIYLAHIPLLYVLFLAMSKLNF